MSEGYRLLFWIMALVAFCALIIFLGETGQIGNATKAPQAVSSPTSDTISSTITPVSTNVNCQTAPQYEAEAVEFYKASNARKHIPEIENGFA